MSYSEIEPVPRLKKSITQNFDTVAESGESTII